MYIELRDVVLSIIAVVFSIYVYSCFIFNNKMIERFDVIIEKMESNKE